MLKTLLMSAIGIYRQPATGRRSVYDSK